MKYEKGFLSEQNNCKNFKVLGKSNKKNLRKSTKITET